VTGSSLFKLPLSGTLALILYHENLIESEFGCHAI
jgi:hypothetical protein